VGVEGRGKRRGGVEEEEGAKKRVWRRCKVECATKACLPGFVARLAVAITPADARRWWSSE